MKRIAICALFALGLTACADPMNRPPAGQVADAKAACAANVETGSHIVDHSCDRSQASSMSSTAFGTAMRQSNPGGLSSH